MLTKALTSYVMTVLIFGGALYFWRAVLGDIDRIHVFEGWRKYAVHLLGAVAFIASITSV